MHKKYKVIFLLRVLFFVLFFAIPVFAQTKIEVLKVYDGDSIKARIQKNVFRIRLIGIDCFEGTSGAHAQKQALRYNLSLDEVLKGGFLAGEILRKELAEKEVYFEFRGIDKYNRALGILYVNNVNINDKMLENPYCKVYKH